MRVEQAVIDFETRSTVDLTVTGVWPYAAHPSTEIMCLSVAVNAARPLLWIPDKFYRLVSGLKLEYETITESRLLGILSQAEKVIAFNAQFEFVIWNNLAVPRRNWPALLLEKLYDVQAQCAYHALPLNLDMAGRALGLSLVKDSTGHKVMLKLCKPRKPKKGEDLDKIYWHEKPTDLVTLFNYCGKDAEAERAIYHTLPQLPEYERRIWLMDQRINARGVPVDIVAVKAVVKVVKQYEQKMLDDFAVAVNGEVSGPRSYVALRNWVNEKAGLNLDSLDKNTTAALIKEGKLDENVLLALQIKSELSKSSVAKLEAMDAFASVDGRARGLFKYHAAATGRAGGVAVQPQNLPRDSYTPEVYDGVIESFRDVDLECLDMMYDGPFYAASRCIRGSFQAEEGCRFLCGDFSSIEAIGLAQLAGQQSTLDTFAARRCLYKTAAAELFNKPYDLVSKAERQVSKCEILAAGYNGGIGAYATMAQTYRVDLETLPPIILPMATGEELDGQYGAKALAANYLSRNPGAMSLDAAIACDIIKRRWRANNEKVVEFWGGIKEASIGAVMNPGSLFSFRGIKFKVHRGFLKCLLPSGRILHYFQPRLEDVDAPWGDTTRAITFMGLKVVEGKTTRQWSRLSTHSGKITENIVQAFCRDLLMEAMLRLEDAGYPVVMHVHDEAVSELENGVGTLDEFLKIMEQVPSWAVGMPIRAEGWEGRRYQK
jgi:DNA polymerase